MGSPWNAPTSRTLLRISQLSDFKKADGWELVKLDFGGNSGTIMPHFILYNKLQGILRVFAWINQSQTFNSAVMTMTSVAGAQMGGQGGQVSAVSGLSQPFVKAADKYQARNQGDELTTYICGFGGSTGWIMGEFTTLFDPNYADPKYYESGLEFRIYGIVRSTVVLGGDIRFTTQPDEGYGFSGTKSQIDSGTGAAGGTAKNLVATGTKFVGRVNGFSDQIDAINKKAKEAASNLSTRTTGPLNGVRKSSELIAKATGSGLPGALKGVFAVAGQAAPILGLLGSVMGALWPDEQSAATPTTPAPVPTISTGSISLRGTIETSTLLGAAILMQVPGTPHNFVSPGNANVRSQQPYYDCPLGLFNLRTTPRLFRYDYPRAMSTSGRRGTVPEEMYTSYAVASDLTPVFNGSAGLEVVSVRAAIAQKVRFTAISELYAPRNGVQRFNMLYAQIMAGNLEASLADAGATAAATDDTYLVQTPFVDAGCFNGMAYNAPTDSLARSPAFIRVAATLRRPNAPPSAAPIFFTQDYAFDDVAPVNLPVSSPNYLSIDDFTPYSSGYPGLWSSFDVSYSGVVFQQYGQTFTAPFSLSFLPGSSLQMDLVRNGGAAGFGGPEGGFRAGTSIGFQGTLNIPTGMDVYMTTDPALFRPCPNPGLRAQSVSNCASYNPWATTQRPVAAGGGAPPGGAARRESLARLQLAPNPASGSTFVSLLGAADDSGGIQRLELRNLSGQLLWQQAFGAGTVFTVEVPLRQLVAGLYLVRATTARHSYVGKLTVE